VLLPSWLSEAAEDGPNILAFLTSGCKCAHALCRMTNSRQYYFTPCMLKVMRLVAMACQLACRLLGAL
jgi:hypothetical protein